MRKFSWMFGIVILSVLGSNASAKVKMLDVIHLTDGNMVTGEIIETIPKETIKIKTTDGKLITYPFDQIEKIDRVEVEFKNRTTATVRAAVFPIFPVGLLSFGIPVFSGWGQFYNGQYLKAVGFLANGFIGANLVVAGASSDPVDNTTAVIGAGMVVGGYILSIVDANLSAKKINQLSNQKINALKLKDYQSEDAPASLNLNYIPHEGLMASYHFRF